MIDDDYFDELVKSLNRGDSMNGKTVDCKHDQCNCSIMSEAADAITLLRKELKIAHAALDEEERKNGISTNGNMWRFWANEARNLSIEQKTDMASKIELIARYLESHAVQSVAPDAMPTPIGDAGWSHVGMKYAKAIRSMFGQEKRDS